MSNQYVIRQGKGEAARWLAWPAPDEPMKWVDTLFWNSDGVGVDPDILLLGDEKTAWQVASRFPNAVVIEIGKMWVDD